MNKIPLLTASIVSLLSTTTAYAICNPPNILKCECAHPIIEKEEKQQKKALFI